MRLCQCVPPSYSSTCGIDGLQQQQDASSSSTDQQLNTASKRKTSSSSCGGGSGQSSSTTSASSSSPQERQRLLDGWPCPLTDACDDDWTWNINDCSHEVKLYGPRSRTVLFHPGWSNGTAAIRGTKPLLAPWQQGSSSYYWEIDVSHRVFGTSLMFGIGTRKADLHAYSFTNLLGTNCHSWGLNHRGAAWHDGASADFTSPFLENTPTTVSLLLDWTRDDGVLEYFKDGKSLGVAFRNISSTIMNNAKCEEDLLVYPMIASTAARTEMCLVRARRKLTTLQDRCAWEIAKCLRSRPIDCDRLELPESLRMCIRKRVLQLF